MTPVTESTMLPPDGRVDDPAVVAFRLRESELRSARRTRTCVGVALFTLVLSGAVVIGKFDPLTLVAGAPKLTDYIGRTLPVLNWATLGDDVRTWFYALDRWLSLLLETVLMAYLATLMGSLGALALCFLASRNLSPDSRVFWAAKRILEFCRTVPDLVFALIFVFAFGLGPLPGILAITLHSLGANGKLFADANENIDMRPVEGLRSLGASWAQTMRYAVIPQVLPNYLSYALWRFELNVRTAAVMGFVGAGGIGVELIVAVRSLYYEDISAIVLLIVATVTCIDIGCAWVRHHLIGREAFA